MLACLGSQYAGWQLTHGEGDEAYFSMGSGPARALAGKEDLFRDIAYADRSEAAVLVLETGSPPPEALVRRIAATCDIAPEALTIITTPTQSMAGSVQIVGRVVEVALHKAHELNSISPVSSKAWGRRRSAHPIPISSRPWAAPTTR